MKSNMDPDDPNNNKGNLLHAGTDNSSQMSLESMSSTSSDSAADQLRQAMQEFDVPRLRELLAKAASLQEGPLCAQKPYSNLLHWLANAYTSFPLSERPAGLKLKFIDVLKILQQYGVDLNRRDGSKSTVLHVLAAAGRGQADVLRVLLANGNIRVNEPDRCLRSALHIAVIRGGRQEVEVLLDSGSDPNLPDTTGCTPLHTAAKRKRNQDILEMLLCAGALPQQQTRIGGKITRGSSVLHIACKLSCPQNVSVLLRHGATPNCYDDSLQTCLHVAAVNDHSPEAVVVRMLMQAGADLNVQDQTFRETALQKAAKNRMLDVIRIMITHGHQYLKINSQDARGMTALHHVVENISDVSTIMLLMKAGSDPYIQDASGQTPLSQAQRSELDHNAMSVINQHVEAVDRMRETDHQRSPRNQRRFTAVPPAFKDG